MFWLNNKCTIYHNIIMEQLVLFESYNIIKIGKIKESNVKQPAIQEQKSLKKPKTYFFFFFRNQNEDHFSLHVSSCLSSFLLSLSLSFFFFFVFILTTCGPKMASWGGYARLTLRHIRVEHFLFFLFFWGAKYQTLYISQFHMI